MDIEKAKLKFWKGKPILKEQLRPFMNTKSDNTFNQKLSQLVKEGVLRRYENGIYYFPYEDELFEDFKPSITDVLSLKYMRGYSGIETGVSLANKFKLTRDSSRYIEVITNNVSKTTRGKREDHGYVMIKASKFEINRDNIRELEFIELVNNRKHSDYDEKNNFRYAERNLSEFKL